ncbi:MAG: Fic family protein [Solirubrobacterales bacterium]|nr:Fic family protein [Solirubrobacterales bacterium]
MGIVDPYIDEETGELRNLLGTKTATEFRLLEPQLVFANELELDAADIPRSNDLIEVRAIHQHLFRNVYDWAGEIRVVDIKKNDEKSEFFLPSTRITEASDFVFSRLANENFLKGLPPDLWVKRLAYFYDQLNYIHPFREGNGRTQRVFWSRVAADADHAIDWADATGDENDRASRIAAEQLDLTALEAMFTRIVRP